MSFVRACSKHDIEPDRPFLYEWDGDPIAVVELEGDYYAIDDTVTHDRWSLCDGYAEDGEIVCSLHMARFCIRTGVVKVPPACEALKIYPVEVEGDDILLDPDAGAYSET